MVNKATSDLWWRNAVVYCLDVETFQDASGDGVGDFPGLTRRVEYLAGLGVTCLWLLPFYPSGGRDDGYDVTDYYGVDPRFGTLGDFVEFIRAARERGMRVIVDLVLNHTSVEHPWFQQARSSPDSVFRDWYIWADEPQKEPDQIIFPGIEDSNWAYDEAAGQYFLHRFYSSQPDLNLSNMAVRDEINRIMGFWLELGVSGFRLDAVPYLIGGEDVTDEDEPHRILVEMQHFMARRRGDAVLFGEVNLEEGTRERFFGEDGLEMTGLFDFILAGGAFQALATGEGTALAGHLTERAVPPGVTQWLNFLRNHDELNLSHLPPDEKAAVMDAFAPEEHMRIYDRGIRRRLAPMLGGDRKRMHLILSLLFSLPGTPVLFYGDEIGMGDDLSLTERMTVRTPMQWSDRPNAGFSTCEAEQLVRPVVADGDYRYAEVNVARQRRTPDSLLSWMERAIRVRKECPEFGWGAWRVLDVGAPAVLVHRCDWLDEAVIAVHNFGTEPCEITLPLDDDDAVTEIADVFEDHDYAELDLDKPTFTVDGYGFRWLRASHAATRRHVP